MINGTVIIHIQDTVWIFVVVVVNFFFNIYLGVELLGLSDSMIQHFEEVLALSSTLKSLYPHQQCMRVYLFYTLSNIYYILDIFPVVWHF